MRMAFHAGRVTATDEEVEGVWWTGTDNLYTCVQLVCNHCTLTLAVTVCHPC